MCIEKGRGCCKKSKTLGFHPKPHPLFKKSGAKTSTKSWQSHDFKKSFDQTFSKVCGVWGKGEKEEMMFLL